MVKRLTILLAGLLLAFGGGDVLAQTHVSGTVTSSEDGEPVIGASVIVVGTNTGSVTDFDGNFEFTIPQGASKKVTVSYIGMVSQTLQAKENMKITLAPQQQNLDEVMVVAYGTAKKSAYTGAASEIKADKIENRLTSNISQALTGTMAGVQSYQTNGQPGTSATIRIRGISSINGTTSPLYVVDGVPYDGDLSALNPNDIEKMTVLKDAVSTSLYGSRGANGVVMITTKQGKIGRAKITVDAKWGANSREVPNYDVIGNPGTYYEKLYETLYNGYTLNQGMGATAAWRLANENLTTSNGTGYQIYTLPAGQTLIGKNGKLNPLAKLGYSDGQNYFTPDDWEDETFKTTLRQEYNINVSGATDRLNYYASFGYLDDEGTIKGSGFKRFNTRTNIDYKVRDWLTIGSNVAYTHTNSYSPDDQEAADDGSSGNAFYIANNIAPIYPLYVRDAAGNIMHDSNNGNAIYDYGDSKSTKRTRTFMSMANPLSDLIYNKREYSMDIFDGNWFAKADLTHGFTVTARIGLHSDNTIEHSSTNPKYGQSSSYGGENTQAQLRQTSFTHQYLLNYSNSFGRNNINATAGFEGYRWKYEEFYADGQNLYKMGDYTVGNTIDQRRGSGLVHEYRTAGFFFNGSYNWDERYFVNLGYRRDGTSAFSKNNRWGNFFSLGLGWNMKKESWLRDVDWIDLLKIRGSFGQTGNDNHAVGSSTLYAYADQFNMTGASGVFSDGSLAYKGNPDLKWEKTNAFDFGVDYSFWKGRLTGSLDYYFRATDNLLDFKRVAVSNGYSSIPVNMGTVQNYGFEFEANYGIIRNKNLKWDVGLNMTFQKNKIHKLSDDYENGQYISGSRIYKEGQSIYNLYLVHYEGVDPETGRALYTGVKTDDNGQPVTDENGNYTYESTTDYVNAYNYARRSTKSLLPDMFGGLNTSLEWKGFDLSIQTSFQLGGDVFDSGYQGLMDTGNGFQIGNNWHKDILNSWTPTNKNTDIPRADSQDRYSSGTSDRFMISSDYFSIDNITLGYTLPKSLTMKIGIEGLRVYFAADNVALFSARQGLDPRLGITAVSTSFYTSRRSLTGGIKLTF